MSWRKWKEYGHSVNQLPRNLHRFLTCHRHTTTTGSPVMLKLDLSLQCLLLDQPESGMGYQIVEATTFDNQIKRGIAYNAELLLFDEEPRLTLKTTAFARLLNEAQISTGEIKSLHVVTNTASASPAFALRETATSYGKQATPAKDAPIEKTTRKTKCSSDSRLTRTTIASHLMEGCCRERMPPPRKMRKKRRLAKLLWRDTLCQIQNPPRTNGQSSRTRIL